MIKKKSVSSYLNFILHKLLTIVSANVDTLKIKQISLGSNHSPHMN